jgi:hypothetical protein
MPSLYKDDITDQICDGPVIKLVPSSIAGAGVGAVTLTAIGRDQIVFAPRGNCFIYWGEVAGADDTVLDYIKKICHHNKHGFWIDRYINDIGASYFVNHSMEPNLVHDRVDDIYYAIRDIQVGEELTCTYEPEEIDWV